MANPKCSDATRASMCKYLTEKIAHGCNLVIIVFKTGKAYALKPEDMISLINNRERCDGLFLERSDDHTARLCPIDPDSAQGMRRLGWFKNHAVNIPDLKDPLENKADHPLEKEIAARLKGEWTGDPNKEHWWDIEFDFNGIHYCAEVKGQQGSFEKGVKHH